MENMPLIVAAAVGGLLILIVVIYFLSQKKQDLKDTENTQKMLENLKFDIKDASEDFEDDSLDDTEAVPTVGQSPDVIPPPDPHGLKKAEPEPAKSTKSSKTGKVAEKTRKIEPADDEFEMMDNQNAMVLELTEDQEADLRESGLSEPSIVKKPFIPEPQRQPEPHRQPEPPRKKAAPADDFQVETSIADGDPDMSELDALFEASSDVEEMVLSGQKSSMFDPEAVHEDTSEGDLLDIVFDKPKVSMPEVSPEIIAPPPPVVKTVVKAETPPQEPSALNPEDQVRHEKAKRIARVIVNDIRNYNPDNLAEGIRIGNIMKTLGKEVERGRLLYIKRVPADIAKETNYYREALVKILADGQPELLGF